ncbi:MAG: efflux RND transporter permease subunit, partial [Chlorobiales bacterium]|nr:efflux RND transporter permease subunit [Chlorobiales bacterium]
MLNKIIDLSLRQRFAVLGGLVLLCIAGIYALQKLPIDSLPDVTNNQVQIITAAPGLSPVEAEKLVTFPIETAMNGLPDMEQLRSISKYGLSVVTVVFADDVDPYFARQLVLERLQMAKANLPPAASEPLMGPMSSALGEIYQYQVKGDSLSLTELRTIQDYVIKPRLKTIPGVTEVNSFGGFEKQYQVAVNPLKLQNYELTLPDVFTALEKNNSVSSGNYIEHNKEQYIIRGVGLATGVEDLNKIVIGTRNSVPVLIKDVADVKVGANIRQGAVTRDGNGEIVTGIVMMLRGENSREVISRVEEKVSELNQTFAKQGIQIESFYDQTELVQRTIATVRNNLIEGGLFVVLVLVIFLGNLRAALIVAAVIPVSMLCMFIGMNWLGLSANLMSLGAIDLGMVVDGSVVMMEHMIHRLERERSERVNVIEVIRQSAYEVSRPIFFGVLIILMVYIPILSLQGMEGKMFTPMAFAVGFAILASLILTLTAVPVSASFVLKGKVKHKENLILLKLPAIYSKMLTSVLNHRWKTVSISVAALVLTFSMIPFMGSEFLPELDEGNILVEMKKIPSASLSESISAGEQVARTLKQFPEVKAVVPKTGRPDIANDYMGVNESDIFVTLYPMDQWKTVKTKDELIDTMHKAIMPYTSGAYINFSQPIAMRVNELVSGSKADVAVKIFGDDFNLLNQYAADIQRLANEIKGTESILIEQVSGQPYLNIIIDRQEIARYGINVSNVQDAIETAIGGKVATEILEGQRRYGVSVRLKKDARQDLDAIRRVLIPIPNTNSSLPLEQLAKIEVEGGPAQVSHEETQRRIVIDCNISGRDIGSYVEELQAKINQNLKLGTGYYITYGGQFANQERATARLAIVVPFSIFIIFILLYLMFGKVRYASLLLVNLPFALVGGILALIVRDLPISVTASVG